MSSSKDCYSKGDCRDDVRSAHDNCVDGCGDAVTAFGAQVLVASIAVAVAVPRGGGAALFGGIIGGVGVLAGDLISRGCVYKCRK
ncbi:hypothetical protein ACWPKS_12855 [Coraliomargarita sp. W4R72]